MSEVRGVLWRTLPLTYAMSPNSGWLPSELHWGVTQGVLEEATCLMEKLLGQKIRDLSSPPCFPVTHFSSLGLSFPICKIRGLGQMASEGPHSPDVL